MCRSAPTSRPATTTATATIIEAAQRRPTVPALLIAHAAEPLRRDFGNRGICAAAQCARRRQCCCYCQTRRLQLRRRRPSTRWTAGTNARQLLVAMPVHTMLWRCLPRCQWLQCHMRRDVRRCRQSCKFVKRRLAVAHLQLIARKQGSAARTTGAELELEDLSTGATDCHVRVRACVCVCVCEAAVDRVDSVCRIIPVLVPERVISNRARQSKQRVVIKPAACRTTDYALNIPLAMCCNTYCCHSVRGTVVCHPPSPGDGRGKGSAALATTAPTA